MILSCSNISKAFGSEVILENISFHIEEHEKAAVVGINGAGKTTLLKIIIGELPADSGNVVIARGKTIGYLAQHQDLESSRTIYEEVLEIKRPLIQMEERIRQLEKEMKHVQGDALESMFSEYSRLNHQFELENGYAYQSEVIGVLQGLGFGEDEFEKKVNTLSGGQKTRVSLGRLLLSNPDIILLDEPTNHLDMESITALNNGMIKFPGVLLFSSRDHQIVQTTANRIIELLPGGTMIDKITTYDEYLESDAMARKRTVYSKAAGTEEDN